MKDELKKIGSVYNEELDELETDEQVQKFKSRYLGRNGVVTSIVRNLKNIPVEQRAEVGKLANELKKSIGTAVDAAFARVQANRNNSSSLHRSIDVTLPGRRLPIGSKHPITLITEQITSIFSSLGFDIVEGPEIELDFFNFEALNIPRDHPARDMHDTFYISDELLLRTHTSPVQIRTMQQSEPPLRIICPGKVYRCDSDVSHTPMFHQIEGLLVDRHVTLGDLKGLLTVFIHRLFDESTAIRFRASYFPFTEPSAEVDIQCVICGGDGCRVCSGTGWLEILGSGLVNPKVFKNAGYDPGKVTGLAFGLGVERIAMLKYGINDIRLFFENDFRFLNQFH